MAEEEGGRELPHRLRVFDDSVVRKYGIKCRPFLAHTLKITEIFQFLIIVEIAPMDLGVGSEGEKV